MRAQNLAKWTDPVALEGLLIYAEGIEELLFDHTLDSFKSPALNFHVSIMEARSLLTVLVEERIGANTLAHTVEELKSHLHDDPVVPRPIPAYWLDCVNRLQNLETSPKKLFHHADALLIDVGQHYWRLLKEAIRVAVQDARKKEHILALARAFTAEVELEGFSRRYVYYENIHFFFDPNSKPDKINSLSHVNSFIRMFDRRPTARQAILRCSQAYSGFAERGEPFGITISPIPPDIENPGQRTEDFLAANADFPLYAAIQNISARDEYVAHDETRSRFDLFTDVCRFAHHTAQLDTLPTALVSDQDYAHAGVLVPAPNPMACHADRGRDASHKLIQRSIEILSGQHFSPRLRGTFRKVLDYHEAALAAKTPENQLLNLWASLEGFLPPPDKRTVRINYCLGAFIPVLRLTYARSILDYVSASMRSMSDRVADFVTGIRVPGAFEAKATALLTCEEFDAERIRLCELIDFSPLLRYRCYWCYRNFSTTKSIFKVLQAHQVKITWHIKRIYTTRNQIVHSAQSLPYIETLVENLHSYLDVLIDCVVRVGIAAKQLADIDTLLTLFQGYARAHAQLLEGGDRKCTVATHIDYLHGIGDPLAG